MNTTAANNALLNAAATLGITAEAYPVRRPDGTVWIATMPEDFDAVADALAAAGIPTTPKSLNGYMYLAPVTAPCPLCNDAGFTCQDGEIVDCSCKH